METPQFLPLGEGLELTQVEQQEDQLVLPVTRVKLIKRMLYGKAWFALLRQQVLHRI